MKKILLLICAVSALSAFSAVKSSAQSTNVNAFSNAPSVFQPALDALQLIPSRPLIDSQVIVDTGIWTGPSLSSDTTFQNYLDADYRIHTNFSLGGELRNTFNEIDYLGVQANYTVATGPSGLFCPGLRAGWGFRDQAPQIGVEPLHFRYQSSPGAPCIDAGAGAVYIFHTRDQVVSTGGPQNGKFGLGAHLGLFWAF